MNNIQLTLTVGMETGVIIAALESQIIMLKESLRVTGGAPVTTSTVEMYIAVSERLMNTIEEKVNNIG